MYSNNFSVKASLVLFVILNIAALLLFADFLYKVIALEPLDIDRSIAFLSLMPALLLVTYGTRFRLMQIRTHISLEYVVKKRFYFLGYIALLGLIVALWYTLPWFSNKNFNKGEELYSQGKINEALVSFTKSHHQDPNNTDAILALARIYSEDRPNDELAEMYYELGVTKQKKAYKALNNMALWKIKQGKYDNAISILVEARDNLIHQVAQSHNNFSVYMGIIEKNMALAHWKADQLDAALSALSKAERFLNKSGQVSEYPDYYCLKSLILPVHEGEEYVFQCNEAYANWEESDLTKLDKELLRETSKRYE